LDAQGHLRGEGGVAVDEVGECGATDPQDLGGPGDREMELVQDLVADEAARMGGRHAELRERFAHQWWSSRSRLQISPASRSKVIRQLPDTEMLHVPARSP